MKQNGRAWITLLISVLVALAVLTLSACGFGTPDDDKDPSGTGGLTEEEMDSLISDRVSEADWNAAWNKVLKSSARTADFSIAAEIVESDSEQSNEYGIKCMFGGGRVYGKEIYKENSVSDSYEYYYEYDDETDSWYCYKRDKSGDWEKSVEEKDCSLLRFTRSRFYFMADSHNAYPKFLLPPRKGMEQAIRHQPDGSTENETALDKRCCTPT